MGSPMKCRGFAIQNGVSNEMLSVSDEQTGLRWGTLTYSDDDDFTWQIFLKLQSKMHYCRKLFNLKNTCFELVLKGVYAKNKRGYRLTAKNKRFWSLLILLLSVASRRRKLLKTTHTEERFVHTNSESCNI